MLFHALPEGARQLRFAFVRQRRDVGRGWRGLGVEKIFQDPFAACTGEVRPGYEVIVRTLAWVIIPPSAGFPTRGRVGIRPP